MNDSRNLIYTLILSTVVLLSWQFFVVEPEIQQRQKLIAAQQKKQKAELVNNNEVKEIVTREKAIVESPRIKVLTDKITGSISLKGARIDDLLLVEYKETMEEDSSNVVLLSPGDSETAYFAEFGWVSGNSNIKTPNSSTLWKSDKSVLEINKPVTLSWNNNQGLTFIIKINVDKDYLFTIDKTILNDSGNSVGVSPYGIINRIYNNDSSTSYAILHEGPLAVADDILHEERYEDLRDDKKMSFRQTRGWLGITDKYWLTALIPDQSNSFDINFNYFYKNKQNRYQTDYLGQQFFVAPGESETSRIHFFAGAKKLEVLDKYQEQLNINLFDRAVDFGWLYFLTKPIFQLLTFFNGVFGNFGLAILMLTVCIKLLLFPLANKSYNSMSRLKLLQPQLVELKNRFENDKMQLNKEMMALYKREKVNPASGCLPILLQIPVFFALYKVLFITIEMRHAPFFGWIKDLSMQDPTSIFNLFGILPWDPPSFLLIGVWPLILGFTMLLQQKLNPAPTDPMQAKVMKLLPIIFTFVFATFPAGLVIYWSWNNALSIIQQWIIMRSISKKKGA